MEMWPTSTEATSRWGKARTVANSGIWGRRRVTLTLTLRKINDELIDLVEEFFTIGRDLHIYRWLDIALSINMRVLIKHDENLYSYSTLIHEKWTLQFGILELPVLLPGAFLNYHNFLVQASNYVFYISILIVSTRASLLVLQIFSLAPSYGPYIHFFVSRVKSNEIFWETSVHNMQNMHISPTCEIHNADLDIEILTILQP
jgi:hypothetical protein